MRLEPPYTILDNNTRVFHSDKVKHPSGFPVMHGWYWEWNENGSWLGPFKTDVEAVTDAERSMPRKRIKAL